MKGILRLRCLLFAGLTGVAAALLLAACGGASGEPAAGQSHGPATTSQSATATFNDADTAFAQNMIPHHQQAVQMAELAASRTTDPQIRQLAAQIKAAQAPEIQTLTGWLTSWGKPMMPAQGHGGMAMPGMMSDADMTRLMSAKGVGFDRMFAQMMIAHHNGAMQMARDEQARGANTDAKALAATIERTQSGEVTTLQAILDRL